MFLCLSHHYNQEEKLHDQKLADSGVRYADGKDIKHVVPQRYRPSWTGRDGDVGSCAWGQPGTCSVALDRGLAEPPGFFENSRCRDPRKGLRRPYIFWSRQGDSGVQRRLEVAVSRRLVVSTLRLHRNYLGRASANSDSQTPLTETPIPVP